MLIGVTEGFKDPDDNRCYLKATGASAGGGDITTKN